MKLSQVANLTAFLVGILASMSAEVIKSLLVVLLTSVSQIMRRLQKRSPRVSTKQLDPDLSDIRSRKDLAAAAHNSSTEAWHLVNHTFHSCRATLRTWVIQPANEEKIFGAIVLVTYLPLSTGLWIARKWHPTISLLIATLSAPFIAWFLVRLSEIDLDKAKRLVRSGADQFVGFAAAERRYVNSVEAIHRLASVATVSLQAGLVWGVEQASVTALVLYGVHVYFRQVELNYLRSEHRRPDTTARGKEITSRLPDCWDARLIGYSPIGMTFGVMGSFGLFLGSPLILLLAATNFALWTSVLAMNRAVAESFATVGSHSSIWLVRGTVAPIKCARRQAIQAVRTVAK